MTATSRQLVGKLAMTVLKMRPKLGHISRMLLARSREEIPDNLSEIITKKDTGKSWAKLAQLFYNDFRPSWDEVEESRQLGETFDGGGAADLWPTWPQVEKWCSS